MHANVQTVIERSIKHTWFKNRNCQNGFDQWFLCNVFLFLVTSSTSLFKEKL